MHSRLHTLIYFSEIAFKGKSKSDEKEIVSKIVKGSARRNLENGITGLLYYDGGWFTQVLEGPADKLEETFERIALSHQHKDIRVIEYCRSEKRIFQDWNMKLISNNKLNLSRSELSSPRHLAETLHELRGLIDNLASSA